MKRLLTGFNEMQFCGKQPQQTSSLGVAMFLQLEHLHHGGEVSVLAPEDLGSVCVYNLDSVYFSLRSIVLFLL